jgi:copper chaperone NosL
MKEFVRIIIIGSLAIFLWSCDVEPQAIRFGSDQCDECKMTISDHRFGAEIVTKKGRIKKFDSVECLLDYLQSKEAKDLAHVLVIDYANPQTLIDAKNAKYLISKEIPSPMGGFLSAYSGLENEAKSGGELHSWSSLNRKIRKR